MPQHPRDETFTLALKIYKKKKKEREKRLRSYTRMAFKVKPHDFT